MTQNSYLKHIQQIVQVLSEYKHQNISSTYGKYCRIITVNNTFHLFLIYVMTITIRLWMISGFPTIIIV